jgi:hypothetical protein
MTKFVAVKNTDEQINVKVTYLKLSNIRNTDKNGTFWSGRAEIASCGLVTMWTRLLLLLLLLS